MSFTNYSIILVVLFITSVKSDINLIKGITDRMDATKEAIRANLTNKTVASETHHAICIIKTEEIVAKAESSASRILSGVCTSDEVTKAFKNIEKLLIERLEHFERSLLSMIESKFQPTVQRSRNYKNSKSSAFKTIDYIIDENIFKNYT